MVKALEVLGNKLILHLGQRSSLPRLVIDSTHLGWRLGLCHHFPYAHCPPDFDWSFSLLLSSSPYFIVKWSKTFIRLGL